MSPLRQVWMSFADETGNLGVAIVDVMPIEVTRGRLAAQKKRAEVGTDPNVTDDDALVVGAMIKSHALGINPGGGVSAIEVPDEQAADYRARGMVGRLLSRADLEALGEKLT